MASGEESNGEDIFRSAPMALIQLFVGGEIARDVVGALGRLGLVQFRNLNEDKSGFQQTFVGETRRFDEVLRQLRQLEARLEASAIEISDAPAELYQEPLGPTHEVNELIDRISTVSNKIADIMSAEDRIAKQRNHLLMRREVLRSADDFFTRKQSLPVASSRGAARDESRALLLAEEARMEFDIDDDFDIESDDVSILGTQPTGNAAAGVTAGLGNRVSSPAITVPLLTGVISRRKFSVFERLAWRVTRGNIYLANFPIEQPVDGELKDVFIAYTHGDAMAARARSVAESMDATLVKVDNHSGIRKQDLQSVNEQLNEIFSILDSMKRTSEMEVAHVASQLNFWKAIIVKERAVYATLNYFSFDHGRRSLIAEGWAPRSDIPQIQEVLQDISAAANVSTPAVLHEIQTTKRPPTYHRTNKVTGAFQAIVDVYGIATYQEVNPALPAIVTFPFMFAVMFGDIGHGIILGLAALAMVLKERSIAKMKRDEIFDMAFGGRYVLLLMGVFSIFTGLMYNDVFSKSMTIFSTSWKFPEHKKGESVAAVYDGSPYPIGLDWGWHGADNNLLFTNSYKMKLSILMGFVHMTYSLFFQLENARYFHSWVDIVGNFIPGLLFMQSIFGYLSLMIIYKWSVDWIKHDWEAPGLLNMVINMFLSPGTIDAHLYRGQAIVQNLLLIIAVVCVPWLLLFKPLYLRRENQRAVARGYQNVMQQAHQTEVFDAGDDVLEAGGDFVVREMQDEHNEPFEFGEVMIHQVIHTIEFCLNCVSHTASYLRLWALSLAHNQLSSVLWNMTIQNAFGPTGVTGVAIVFFLFAMWFVGTVVVLVCMEGTSAMLHSLRLHWVEAMSKHFEGEGYAFVPFSFKTLASE